MILMGSSFTGLGSNPRTLLIASAYTPRIPLVPFMHPQHTLHVPSTNLRRLDLFPQLACPNFSDVLVCSQTEVPAGCSLRLGSFRKLASGEWIQFDNCIKMLVFLKIEVFDWNKHIQIWPATPQIRQKSAKVCLRRGFNLGFQYVLRFFRKFCRNFVIKFIRSSVWPSDRASKLV